MNKDSYVSNKGLIYSGCLGMGNNQYSVTKKITRKCIFFLGLFSTMPNFVIYVGGNKITFFSIIFFLSMVILLLNNSVCLYKVHVGRVTGNYFLWLMLLLGSSIVTLVLATMYPEIEIEPIKNDLKIVLFLVFAYLWSRLGKDTQNTMTRLLLKGLIKGGEANLLWGCIDAVYYYTTRISLNNTVFSAFIERGGAGREFVSIIEYSGLYRTGGFNSDPAQFGFICPLIMAYGIKKREYSLVLLSVGGLLASATTTGLVSCLFVIGVCVYQQRNGMKLFTFKRFHMGRLSTLAVLIVGMYGVYLYRIQLVHAVSSAIEMFYTRVTGGYMSKRDIRTDFIIAFPDAFLRVGILNIFGMGIGMATFGYAYSEKAAELIHRYLQVYDMENTYLAYFFDCGMVGFILFFLLLYTIFTTYYKKTKNRAIYNDTQSIIFSGIIAIMPSILFYHYILYAPHMLILMMGVFEIDSMENKKMQMEF